MSSSSSLWWWWSGAMESDEKDWRRRLRRNIWGNRPCHQGAGGHHHYHHQRHHHLHPHHHRHLGIIIIMLISHDLYNDFGNRKWFWPFISFFNSANNSPMIDTIHSEMINSLIFILTEEGEWNCFLSHQKSFHNALQSKNTKTMECQGIHLHLFWPSQANVLGSHKILEQHNIVCTCHRHRHIGALTSALAA